jgi:hypothetical protein
MLNLLKIFERIADEELETEAPGAQIKDLAQISFHLSKGGKATIIADISNPKPANYFDLPELQLSEKERKIVEDNPVKPPYHDGHLILVTGVFYNQETKEVFYECKRTRYSVVQSITFRKFDTDSKLYSQPYYQLGVVAPFITNDNKTFLLQRKDHRYSAIAGFIEAHEDRNIIKDLAAKFGPFETTAVIEIIEELLGNADESEKFKELLKKFTAQEITPKQFLIELQEFSKREFGISPIFICK